METQEESNRSRVKKVESKDSWDSFLNQAKDQGRPIVVHFGASWCMPSIAMNSFFEELASTYPDVMFFSVDVDDVKSPRATNDEGGGSLEMLDVGCRRGRVKDWEVASKMEVKAMPTFVLLNKDGTPVDKLVGANPEEIRKRVDSFIQSSGEYAV
ncbi:hypothetical protein Cgig2_030896 [Carnegiea gigantea]|uniref:Thioredoxin domain-containing protein n=1 Tax=Carnegiea gigantea TaxID=171969 RepID=A0A9Q1JMS4_9CARY|nr:hypothetical protein Cgig2_030896 [Carnegiea gigantea]